MLFEIPLNTSR